jgi:hypothetical protein
MIFLMFFLVFILKFRDVFLKDGIHVRPFQKVPFLHFGACNYESEVYINIGNIGIMEAFMAYYMGKKKKYFKYLFVGMYFFIGGIIYSQQIIFHIGDNITEYINRNPPLYLAQGTFLYDIPDGGVDLLIYKTETSEIDTKFLVQGSSVFGVMQYENNTTKLLYDITGNGILDISHDSLLIPFWVLSKSAQTKMSRNNNIIGSHNIRLWH